MITLKTVRRTGWLCVAGAIVLCAFIPPMARAQWAQSRAEFEAVAVSLRNDANPASGRLDLYVQVPFSKLEFTSGPDGFAASYSIRAEVSLLDEQGRPLSVIQAPVWEQSLTIPVHAETRSASRFDLTTHTLLLDPGSYLIAVQLSDLVSRRNFFLEIASRVRRFDAPLGLSDIVLLDDVKAEGQSLTPRLSQDIAPNATQLPFHYEVYADADQTIVLTEELRLRPGIPPVFAVSDTVHVAIGRHHRVSAVPTDRLERGRYQLMVSLLDGAGRRMASVSQLVAARWSGLDTSLYNLDEAIAQLAYVASGREIGAIRRAPTEAERLLLFQEFWRKQDPTPGTDRNERMEEHYYRINYANRHFGRNAPGWLTDRGQVFVLHGPPEDVQRQVYSYNNRPWEMWYYYSIGRQFVFVDRTGFGDYELVVPMWDDRTRLD
ncbi:MAG: GWxTD domain-containing protein [Bacteroidota bacterium]|nr:GWxTD domain-containing protein [Bacteroidota bacterium]